MFFFINVFKYYKIFFCNYLEISYMSIKKYLAVAAITRAAILIRLNQNF